MHITRAKWGLLVLCGIAGLAALDTWAFVMDGSPGTLSAAISYAGIRCPMIMAIVPFAAGVLYGHWFFPRAMQPPAQ